MIDTFESTARVYPDREFVTCVDAAGNEESLTYRQARLLAAAMARRLREKGVREGDCVSVDLPNCLEYVLLALAAGYGSFTLVALNHRLTEPEKLARLMELERSGVRVALRIDAERAARLMEHVRSTLAFGGAQAERVDDGISAVRPGRGPRHAAPHSGSAYVLRQKRARSIMGEREDALREIIHFAERAAHLFEASRDALVMFTSGTTGKSKAVRLTWTQLVASARAANRALGSGACLWQATLPLYHVGGFQILTRSIEARRPLRLYQRFDAHLILSDASRVGATHLSVVDKMLQDLLAADARGVLATYRCVLLGGGPLNDQTLERARRARVRVYASYGMTETASQVANALVNDAFSGGLALMPGYEARIVDPDERGFGSLAVKGPGVFSGYVNAQAAFTVDGYFLTGDVAALRGGLMYLRERTSDMFISGGENIYPAEIAAALKRVPGVSDAHVFGVPDATWGRRPVAVVERSRASMLKLGPLLTENAARELLSASLSKVYLPDRLCFVDELPRAGIGKIDRAAVEELYAKRIEVERVILHRVRLPFTKPFKTAKATLTHRELIIVEVVDGSGRRGLGECVSFETDWYLPETVAQDWLALEGIITPMVKGAAFLHPREVSRLFAAEPKLRALPMACAAMENALWDLYGRIVGRPLWQLLREEYERVEACLIEELAALPQLEGMMVKHLRRDTSALLGETRAMVPAGAVVGMGGAEEVLSGVRACVEAGYRRVKMKVSPGEGLDAVRAVRAAFPQLLVTLDANQSFPPYGEAGVRAYDELGIGWIEEPLAPSWGCSATGRPAFERLNRLQQGIATPVCLDESFINVWQAREALAFDDLRCLCVKVGKFGGVQPALEFVCLAQLLGREVWMGGMYDTGVSKRLHAAFQTLPGLVVPGDIGSTSRYFATDITLPAYEASHGYVTVNPYGYESGLGCTLNKEALKRVRVERREL